MQPRVPTALNYRRVPPGCPSCYPSGCVRRSKLVLGGRQQLAHFAIDYELTVESAIECITTALCSVSLSESAPLPAWLGSGEESVTQFDFDFGIKR